MSVTDKQVRSLGPWRGGVDQLSREDSLPERSSSGSLERRLREALNVDIEDDGKVRRRSGYTSVVGQLNAHSLFTSPSGRWVYFNGNGSIYALDSTNDSVTLLGSGYEPLYSISYANVNGVTYFSNGSVTGVIDEDTLSILPWGIEPPSVPSSASGDLLAALTYVTNTGEESGAAAIFTTGTTLALPSSSDSRVVSIRVYASPDNGDEVYLYKEVPNGTPSVDLSGNRSGGVALETAFCDRMPAGHIVRYFNGRIYVASKNVLYWSLPLYYGVHDTAANFLYYSDPITLMEPIGEEGIYVSAGKRTYFLSGRGPEDFSQAIRHPAGAVPGTGQPVRGGIMGLEDDRLFVYWWSKAGYPVLGGPDGRVLPIRDSQIASGEAESGATILREWEGLTQLITMLRGSGQAGLRVTDSAEVTVTRVDSPTI